VTSTLGDARASGARVHAGNDFESTEGEPVRAVADGKVVFAGVDLMGSGAASRLPIWAQREADPDTMGAGGLYVCLDHGESSEGESLITCYMHLEAATVVQDRVVSRGEQVGRVGTSGIKQSRPHLHFELRSKEGVWRASDILRGVAIGQPVARPADEGATMSGTQAAPTFASPK
jgi:murein DD-endopeptidase MepM/ murein hydrolase activator NlpD